MKLPTEIQKYIGSFLYVHTRYGLPESQKTLWNKRRNEYYTRIRRVPRGVRYDLYKTEFYMRHGTKRFEWLIIYNTMDNQMMDIWRLFAFDTWDSSTCHKTIFHQFTNTYECWDEDPSVLYCSDTQLTLYFIKDNQHQSRQSVLFELTDLIRTKYWPLLETIYKETKMDKVKIRN